VAWNVPGGSGEKDPWGQRRRGEKAPPDLDEIVRNLQRKLTGLFGGRGGGNGGPGFGRAGGFGAGLILTIAAILWGLTGFYIVNQGERGAVLRFGKLSEITEAGLRWHLPYPIEGVEKVNVEKVNPIEIGYRSTSRTGARTKVEKEALMLTEDENIIDIEFAVQYLVKDAADYLFNVQDPDGTVKQATEAAVREIVGRNDLDYVFEHRAEISTQTRELLQRILDEYKAGIDVRTVEMQDAQPPAEVKAAFDDAVKAREDRERLKNEAEAYANDIIPKARGAAARLIQEAEGYKAKVVGQAEGDARRFVQVAGAYAKAPAVTRERLYIEALEQVLSHSTKVFIDQKTGNQILYLPLDRIVPAIGNSAAGLRGQGATEVDTVPSPGDSSSGRARTDLRRRGSP
jgi:membrane protease subunit HflK